MESDSSGRFPMLFELPVKGCEYQRVTQDNLETRNKFFELKIWLPQHTLCGTHGHVNIMKLISSSVE